MRAFFLYDMCFKSNEIELIDKFDRFYNDKNIIKTGIIKNK